jgi:hypothetical protein
VSNRAIEDHLPSPSNAQAERRVKSCLVEVHDRAPDRLDIVAPEPNRTRISFRGAARGHLIGIEDTHSLRCQTTYFPTLHAYLHTH